MGLYPPILIAAALLGSTATVPPARSCLGCHASHHGETATCTVCHRGDPRSSRPEIAHHDLIGGRFAHFAIPGSPVTEAGRKAIERSGCQRCHVIAGKGNRYARDLDRLLPRARPEEVLAALEKPALFMPRFALTESTAVLVVNALFAGSAASRPPEGESPLVVHFESAARQEHAFTRRCGGCHRLLTGEREGLGAGSIGPNLSGLFTPFYPGTLLEGERWTPARFREWLENPRQFRPLAEMPSVKLTEDERHAIESALGVVTSFTLGGATRRAGPEDRRRAPRRRRRRSS